MKETKIYRCPDCDVELFEMVKGQWVCSICDKDFDEDELSESEERAKQNLIELCKDIVNDYGDDYE